MLHLCKPIGQKGDEVEGRGLRATNVSLRLLEAWMRTRTRTRTKIYFDAMTLIDVGDEWDAMDRWNEWVAEVSTRPKFQIAENRDLKPSYRLRQNLIVNCEMQTAPPTSIYYSRLDPTSFLY